MNVLSEVDRSDSPSDTVDFDPVGSVAYALDDGLLSGAVHYPAYAHLIKGLTDDAAL